jgi:hypothetical protein
MDWTRDRNYDYKVFTCSENFNGDTYKIMVYIEESHKSVKFYIGASSGNKRDKLEIFEEKQTKSRGGIKALLWIKSKMFEFPEYFDSRVKNQYICISWSDNRRRNIYKRLEKEGFQFMVEDGKKILMKKL